MNHVRVTGLTIFVEVARRRDYRSQLLGARTRNMQMPHRPTPTPGVTPLHTSRTSPKSAKRGKKLISSPPSRKWYACAMQV